MIDNDTLILFYFNESLSDSERSQVARDIANDSDTALRYKQLSEDLANLNQTKTVAAPGSAIARWRMSLDQLVESETRDSRHWLQRFFPAIAVSAAAAVLAVGITIGWQFNTQDTSAIVNKQVSQSTRRVEPTGASDGLASSFTRGLTAHLQQTQLQMVSLSTADPAQRAQLILEIIEQNRFFQQIAEANGDADIARLLRAFEPVLVVMASTEAESRLIDAQKEKLSFELGVTLNKLNHRPSNLAYKL